MVQTLPSRLPVPPARSVERALGTLFVALLGTYALGSLVEGVAPPLHAAGVLAVHLAVVVGLAIPLSVLGRALHASRVESATGPGTAPVVVAAAVVTALVAALAAAEIPGLEPLADPLAWITVGGLLVLAGLVVGRR